MCIRDRFIGESVAVNPSYFAFTGAVMDLGYDNPLDVVDWKVYSSYDDALVAVQNGEVKYALMGTQNNYCLLYTSRLNPRVSFVVMKMI